MKNPIIEENFLLLNKTAQKLYHDYCKDLPIIDYHSHLEPNLIDEDYQFKSITEIWLGGDHYKWRALRANGVEEKYITGQSSDFDKFKAWAETVPYTLRNPLYHWTALELKRYFDEDELLNENNAQRIFDKCNEKLVSKEFSVKSLLKKMNVEVVCSTDDPIDDLKYHKNLKDYKETKVLPTFRPDKIFEIDHQRFRDYIEELSKVSGVKIGSFKDLMEAVKQRVDYFHEIGGRLSDHGLRTFYSEVYGYSEVNEIFHQKRMGKLLSEEENNKFKSAILHELCKMYHEKGWVQQFHVGAIRNNNERMLREIGADGGYDSIGDPVSAYPMSKFFNDLDDKDQLAKSIIYNLNPSQNAMFATMTGNFNSYPNKGKIQYGAAWWFLDQKHGIERQLDDLSDFGLLFHFVGMLTDSRSFLSFPRHEYFRRILCNKIGTEVENGLIPNDQSLLKKLLQGVCYFNAKNYFNL